MCGINYNIYRTMNFNSISHRGIESNTIDFKGIKFNHHRLPIQTEIGDDWHQPFETDDFILLYNGEIFNYPRHFENDVEFIVDFIKKNIRNHFILKLEEFLNTLDGFWSMVIFDKHTNNTWAFTDPLGKKQLYMDHHMNISSEIKPLYKDFMVIDKLYKSTLYKFGYNHDERTVFTQIKRLLPNTVYLNGRKVMENYYIWKNIDGSLYDILKKSVNDRLMTKNHRIGLLLSGGLDSSIITYLLDDYENIDFLSIDNDEFKYVEIIEKDLGIKVKKIPMSYTEDDILEIFKYSESPIDLGSLINQYILFSNIKNKVVLSGDGADELFGGYSRINDYDSQYSDIFHELSYYHLPKLDRTSMAHTIELRNPFLAHNVVGRALRLDYKDRMNKKILKDTFRGIIPDVIIDRKKVALKSNEIKKDKIKDRYYKIDLFYENIDKIFK